MPTQLPLLFDDVPVMRPTQERCHAIAPILAGRVTPIDRARVLAVSYATVMRWVSEFRDRGMAGLFDQTQFPRSPYTPEKVVVLLVYFKTCAPKASDRELARVLAHLTGRRLHNETIRDLLERYFFWKHPEFQQHIHYPVPLDPDERRLDERSRAPLTHPRKVYFGTIRAVLELQKKYGYAGWFRIKGYLERDYGIVIGETTLKKIMQLNRRVHLAPSRPLEVKVRDAREGPLTSTHPFEHVYVDFRYLDARPEGVQLYSTLLIEGLSRTILAGSLTERQDVGVLLRVYYLALLEWGCREQVISDHGGQFLSNAFERVNRRLGIEHNPYEKGHPWQSLVESQFGIQARLGEYHWERCRSVNEAVEFHRDLIRDHNRLPHFAHRLRNDGKHAPLEVLGARRGRQIEVADLHRAFSRKTWKRRTDARGFVRVNRWKIYIEQGLPRVPIQVTFWDGKLRAEYGSHLLAEYRCKFDEHRMRPKAITSPTLFETPFRSPQPELFDPLWVRDPVELEPERQRLLKAAAGAEQLRLYLGPELVR